MSATRAVERDTSGEVGSRSRLTGRQAARIAWANVGVVVVIYTLAILGETRAGPDALPLDYGGKMAGLLSVALVGVITGTVGAVIVAGRPDHRLGWLFVITSLLGAIFAVSFYAVRWIGVTASSLTIGAAIATNALTQPFIFLSGALVLLWFPDGRLSSPRWRWALLIAVAGAILRGLENLAAPLMTIYPTVPNPVSVGGGPLGDLLTSSHDLELGIALQQLGLVLAALSLVARYRGADRTLRRQIGWVALAGIGTAILTIPLAYVTLTTGTEDLSAEWALLLFFIGYALIPLACLVAITRHRLYEIDRIVNRAVLYGLLTAALAGVFAGIVTLSERVLVAVSGASSDVTVVLAAIVVAMTYHPVRHRIESFVDRRLRFEHGRLGPYEQQLRAVLEVVDPDRALDRLLHEAVAAVDAVGGSVDAPSGTIVVGAWTPDTTAVTIPIAGPHGPVGQLRLAGQVDGDPYTDEQVASLRTIVALVGEGLDATSRVGSAGRGG